jgi:hypothetical protein
MRIVLADPAPTDGLVSKDAAAGRSILFTASPLSVRRARPTLATASGAAAC